MASALAFSGIMAVIPLLILGIGVTGYVLPALVTDPIEAIVAFALQVIPGPVADAELREGLRGLVADVVAQRSGFTLVGALFFVWLATRFVGSLRIILRTVFAPRRDRGLVHGKLFDMLVVLIGVLLVTANLGTALLLKATVAFGGQVLGVRGTPLVFAEGILGRSLALASIWILFFLVYRYVPAAGAPWRTAVVAATFASVLHELLKSVFSWYVLGIADFSSVFGNLATVAALFFWIYYEATVFILGSVVAHVTTTTTARPVRMQGTVREKA
jgi:membrane protein